MKIEYKVGDRVVSKSGDLRIFKFTGEMNDCLILKCSKGKGYIYPKDWLRHATPEEIQAGRRLEVCGG